MRALLDTHTFLWFAGGSSRLGMNAHTIIEDKSTRCAISIASLWEMAIKIALGRLDVGEPFSMFVSEQLEQSGIEVLNIRTSHLAHLIALPFHHRDPFDRLIVAQALVEEMALVSTDAILDAYGVTRIW